MSNKRYFENKTWYDQNGFGGHYDEHGNKIVDFEPGTDQDFDSHAVEVMNGDGYYDTNGRYKSFS